MDFSKWDTEDLYAKVDSHYALRCEQEKTVDDCADMLTLYITNRHSDTSIQDRRESLIRAVRALVEIRSEEKAMRDELARRVAKEVSEGN